MKYTIDQINIGDQVYFESNKFQSNYDLYWKVIAKNRDSLWVEVNEMGQNAKTIIKISEVIYIIQTGKKQ